MGPDQSGGLIVKEKHLIFWPGTCFKAACVPLESGMPWITSPHSVDLTETGGIEHGIKYSFDKTDKI